MDKTTLSKHKYVYHVYLAQDKRVHFERYPVVYINGMYVYYVRGHKQMLGFLNLISVRDSLEQHIRNNIERGHHMNYGTHNLYCWEIGAEPNELLAQLQELNKKDDKEKQIALAKRRWQMAESSAAAAKQQYEALLKD